jgi:uncharacterized LabA/DUF88 family protein
MIRNKEVIYVFIDSQNLNYGTSKDIKNKNGKIIYKGWKLDFNKFYRYLNDKFHISKAFIFIGYIKENEKLYKNLRQFGYSLIFKPIIKIIDHTPKGNVDAELVLHTAAIEYPNYHQAIIVSGDGDFHCLHKYLKQNHKLKKIVIPNTKSASSLLKEFENFKLFIQHNKQKLEYRPQKMGGVTK